MRNAEDKMSIPYQSQSEIEAVIRGFESCTTPKDDFPHQSHLTVAVSYLHDSGLEQATERMRKALLRFLEHHGVGQEKYNETLTIFWLRLIDNKINELGADLSLLELTNLLISALANSGIVFEYYSPERLNSPEAKRSWIEPELKSF